MEAIYAENRKVYIALTEPTNKFKEEMEAKLEDDREELRLEEENMRKKRIQEEKIKKMRFKFQDPINDVEARGLDFLRKRKTVNKNKTEERTNRLSDLFPNTNDNMLNSDEDLLMQQDIMEPNPHPFMPENCNEQRINPFAEAFRRNNDIMEHVEQDRYNTIHPPRKDNEHHRKQQPTDNEHHRKQRMGNQYGNLWSPSSNSQKSYEKELKEKELNRREAIKLILNYYQKYQQFSGTANEDWRRYLSQFETLCEECNTDSSTRLANFAHSLKPTSNAYHFYQKLRKADKSWEEFKRI